MFFIGIFQKKYSNDRFLWGIFVKINLLIAFLES